MAYHPQNLELLKPDYLALGGTSIERIFGTAKGISKNDTEVVRNKLAEVVLDEGVLKNTFLENCDCSELFDKHYRGLMKF